jgi:hypothetical protein
MPTNRQSFANTNNNNTALLLGDEASRVRHRAILMDHLHQQANPAPSGYPRWLADLAGKPPPAIQTKGKNIKDPVALLVILILAHNNIPV